MFGQPYNPIDVVYDCEIFINFFSMVVTPLDPNDHIKWRYEISARRNDGPYIAAALRSRYFKRMYGFNNKGFDYPLLNRLLQLLDGGEADPAVICRTLKAFAQRIIDDRRAGDKWAHIVHWKQEVVEQADLYLIHHFDNKNRATSLKTLEFNMRSRKVLDLPFHHTATLEPWQMDVVLDYNGNDTDETKRFAHHSREMIEFRDQLGPQFLNANDPKIGKAMFIRALEKRAPGCCYDSERKPRQTWRSSIALADVIFPWIKFETPSANDVLATLKAKVLDPSEVKDTMSEGRTAKAETKGVFKNLYAEIEGFRLDLGTGGLHGSVKNRIVIADALNELVDIDVEAYYPSIAIVNGLYPEHLGPAFVDVYRDLKDQRVVAKRAGNMVESDALKLANNGVYGDSNNMYGPFYDPQYTMAITVNGQLMLVMLVDELRKVPGLQVVQVNTDGMTLKVPRAMRGRFDEICKWWQWGTGMKLEEKQYSRMFIRDVNSYIAQYSNDDINGKDKGKYKRKGAYDWDLKVGAQKAWNKDHSSLIIQKAAAAAMCDGIDPVTFINNHPDPWDFLIREKVTGQSRLVLADGTPCQQTTRLFIATDGQPLIKIMPPLATSKTPDQERHFMVYAEGQASTYGPKGQFKCSICGEHGPTFKFKYQFEEHNKAKHTFKVKPCNVFEGGDLPGLDTKYYLQEAAKLILQ